MNGQIAKRKAAEAALKVAHDLLYKERTKVSSLEQERIILINKIRVLERKMSRL